MDAARERSLPMRNLSVSKIEKFLQCPLAFKYRYVDRIPEPSSGVLHAGRVVHEILEFALKEYPKTGAYPDWKTLDDMFLPAWERKKAEEEAKESFIGWDWGIPEEQSKLQYRPLIRAAWEGALPKVRPWMIGGEPVVEHRIDLELQSDVGPFKLIGYIDLLDDTGVLLDWKTSTKEEVSARQKKLWLQFAAYALYVWPIVGEETLECKKIFLVPGANPRVEWCPFTVGPKHREWFCRIAAEVWKSVYYGAYPARSEGWWCSAKFCSFWGPCQEGLSIPEEGDGR